MGLSAASYLSVAPAPSDGDESDTTHTLDTPQKQNPSEISSVWAGGYCGESGSGSGSGSNLNLDVNVKACSKACGAGEFCNLRLGHCQCQVKG